MPGLLVGIFKKNTQESLFFQCLVPCADWWYGLQGYFFPIFFYSQNAMLLLKEIQHFLFLLFFSLMNETSHVCELDFFYFGFRQSILNKRVSKDFHSASMMMIIIWLWVTIIIIYFLLFLHSSGCVGGVRAHVPVFAVCAPIASQKERQSKKKSCSYVFRRTEMPRALTELVPLPEEVEAVAVEPDPSQAMPHNVHNQCIMWWTAGLRPILPGRDICSLNDHSTGSPGGRSLHLEPACLLLFFTAWNHEPPNISPIEPYLEL